MEDITKAEYVMLADFRYLLRSFLSFSETAARKSGLTPQHHQAMLITMGMPGRDKVTVGELAQRMGTHHNSAVGLVDRLVAHGLMKREQDDSDQRRVYVTLSEQGREKLHELTIVHRRELSRIGRDMQQIIDRIRSVGID